MNLFIITSSISNRFYILTNTLFKPPSRVIFCISVGIRAQPLGLSILTNREERYRCQIDMEEGYFTNKPPLFKGIKYDYLKERMIAHFDSIHIDLLDVIGHGNYILLDN